MSRASLVEGEVFRSETFVVTREASGRLFRLKRTTVPLQDGDIIEALAFFERFLPQAMRPRYAILLDARDAPMETDRDRERRLNEAGGRILQGFSRSAVLVLSVVGKLQAKRMTRETGRVAVFDDEAEALAYLLAELSFD